MPIFCSRPELCQEHSITITTTSYCTSNMSTNTGKTEWESQAALAIIAKAEETLQQGAHAGYNSQEDSLAADLWWYMGRQTETVWWE